MDSVKLCVGGIATVGTTWVKLDRGIPESTINSRPWHYRFINSWFNRVSSSPRPARCKILRKRHELARVTSLFHFSFHVCTIEQPYSLISIIFFNVAKLIQKSHLELRSIRRERGTKQWPIIKSIITNFTREIYQRNTNYSSLSRYFSAQRRATSHNCPASFFNPPYPSSPSKPLYFYSTTKKLTPGRIK